MRTSTLALAACVFAAGCTSRTSSSVAVRDSDQISLSVPRRTSPQPDTAFIEIRRFTRYGFRTPQGGCVSGGASDSRGLPPGIHRVEERVLSFNASMCMSEVALGYRKVWPEPDTTGYASVSISRDLDSAAIAALKRKR